MINCAFIGFGKSATRYHLPYVLIRDKYNVKTIFDMKAQPEVESHPKYIGIRFTRDVNDILQDESVRLVVICTHPDSHFEYARMCIKHGKNVMVEKPFTTTLQEAKELLCLAKEHQVTVTPFQNRRFDACFLTVKDVIKSGLIGDIIEVESHFDYYRPEADSQENHPFNGAFYGLGIHTLDQILSLFGRPRQVAYDIRSLRRDGNPDDMFETQLFYGDVKAIIKTSHLVMTPYPKFIVHGTRGSFLIGQIDQQETCLKNNIMPDDPLFCADREPGVIEYLNVNDEVVKRDIPTVHGDYGRVYDALYETIVNGMPGYVSEADILTNLEILERGFEHASPSIITLDQ
ncbi:oxidoreductase [Klebsiella sp. I138]|uniref:oxidoreductase n=1 Tax=Klebsiella sp. I138 TaxID=2755385 RepID=UPI003DA886BC